MAPEEMVVKLRERVRAHPDDVQAVTLLAPQLVSAGEPDEAARILEAAISQAPADDHLANAAFLTAATAGPEIARRLVAAYEKAYGERGESVEVALSLCRMLGPIAKDDEAARRRQMDLALLGVDRLPDSFQAQINAHHAYMTAGDETKAAEHLARAIALAPRGGPAVPPLAIHLGMMLGKLGRVGEALGVLQDTLRSYGALAHIGGMVTNYAWTEIGLIWLRGGDTDGALRALRASANAPADESLRGSGMRAALADELEKAGKAAEVKWYRDLSERAKTARPGQWLGSRLSGAYLKYLYRSTALALWALISVLVGATLAPLFQRWGAGGSVAEIMIGAVGVWYGLSVLRGVLSRRVAFAGSVIRAAFGLVGCGILFGGLLLIMTGWLYGVLALVIVALPGFFIMVRYEMLLAARRRRA
jgi:tetratricopeptide (TPR) repeat protein